MEKKLQAEITQWWNNNHPQHNKCLFAVNNNSANKLAGSFAKALGVRAGVSDLVLILPHGKVLWIELKDHKGKQSPDQIEFQRQVESLGHTYVIVRSFDEMFELIQKIM